MLLVNSIIQTTYCPTCDDPVKFNQLMLTMVFIVIGDHVRPLSLVLLEGLLWVNYNQWTNHDLFSSFNLVTF